MSNDTISTIKLRLKNNLKIKTSKDKVISALSTRMNANSQSSSCNDYLANCCNCCAPPPGTCVCCNCLVGFIISISGWHDGTCDCSGLNVDDVFVPKIDCGTYTRDCELHGGSAPQGTAPAYTCPDPDGSNVTSFFCVGGQFPGVHYAGISWELYCIDGQLYLKVYHGSNLSLQAGVLGGGTYFVDGFNIWSDLFTPFDCNDLTISGGLSGGGCSDQCACGSVSFTATPVFGGSLAPSNCQCCRPARCESSEPGCANPFPNSFTINLTDNCSGSITTSLTRSGSCWQGTYDTICEECSGDGISFTYTIEMFLCCTGGNWDFSITVVNPDGCSPFSWKSDALTVSDATATMTVGACDPISISSNSGNCGNCIWYTCTPETIGNYCVTSFTITE